MCSCFCLCTPACMHGLFFCLVTGSVINTVGGQTVRESAPPLQLAVKTTGVFNWHRAFTSYALLRAFLYFSSDAEKII